jgi:hypothetical protein
MPRTRVGASGLRCPLAMSSRPPAAGRHKPACPSSGTFRNRWAAQLRWLAELLTELSSLPTLVGPEPSSRDNTDRTVSPGREDAGQQLLEIVQVHRLHQMMVKA